MVVARFLVDPDYRSLLEGGSLDSPRTLAGDTALRERFKTERRHAPAVHRPGRQAASPVRGRGSSVRRPGRSPASSSCTPGPTAPRRLYWHVRAHSRPRRTSGCFAPHRQLRPGLGRLRRQHLAASPRRARRRRHRDATLDVYDPARGRGLSSLRPVSPSPRRIDIAGWDVAGWSSPPTAGPGLSLCTRSRLLPRTMAAISMNKVIHAPSDATSTGSSSARRVPGRRPRPSRGSSAPPGTTSTTS